MTLIKIILLPPLLLPIRRTQQNRRSERSGQPGGIYQPEGRVAAWNGVFQVPDDFGDVVWAGSAVGFAGGCYAGDDG